ncbi:MAG: DUF4973 domain-containing protein [Prevotella sp.]|jgi:hypothetical protein|nr:DUF4973 domain-containing protein [Prevotella sp.]
MKQMIKNNPVNRLIGLIPLLTVLLCACNDEWEDEQYVKEVAFVRSGYVETYLNTSAEDGIVHYKIPIEVCGSTANDRNVEVTIALDPDTLLKYNEATYFRRTDLYYRILEPQYYEFQSMKTTIPAGESVGYIDVDFHINNLDLVEKYILPLQITETSVYTPSPRKHYRRSLMRIIPFNDYSGNYSGTGAEIFNNTGTKMSVAIPDRDMRFVDSNTLFFYAGLTDETALDRSLYKIRVTFGDGTTDADGVVTGPVTLSADSAAINFAVPLPENCYYRIESKMDDLQPYLMIRTITLTMEYEYDNLVNPAYPVRYKFKGPYVLERRRNTQIPEEDQQEIFD